MATLATQSPTDTGATLTFAAASAGGDTVPTGKNVVLLLQNTTSSAITVTPAVTKKVGALTVASPAIAVPAMSIVHVGPLNPDLFANASDHTAHLSYSTATGLGVAALLV